MAWVAKLPVLGLQSVEQSTILTPISTAGIFPRAAPMDGASLRIAELQLENSRLRRLVTDLLLEKVKLEEALQAGKPVTRRASR
jgi:hypothetical protein